MLKLLLAVLIGYLTFLILHWGQFHFFNPTDRINWVLAMAFVGLLTYIFAFLFLPPSEVLEKRLSKSLKKFVKFLPILVGCLLYFLLFIGYLEFYFTADRSITFRMLRITDERPTQSITVDEMLSIYDVKGIIAYRFDDMVYGGYLQKTGDQYSLTPKGRRTLSIYRFTIDFLHMRKF